MDERGFDAPDHEVLAFAAEHRVVLASHVRALLGITRSAVQNRLGALEAAGLLRTHQVFRDQPASYQITRPGLREIGSPLRAPRFDIARYAHDVGLAWLWLAARGGTFGSMRLLISERTMRSLDRRAADRTDSLGVRLGGTGADGRERLHYPDLLLLTPAGRRIAVELELTGKARTRREKILAGYAADARIDAVLYLVTNPATGRAIETSARRLGISDLVHVQRAYVSPAKSSPARSRVVERRGDRCAAARSGSRGL